MEENIINVDGKSKFQDQAIAPSHTCEHIINQTMVRLFGCGRAVSAHVEKKKSKLDFRMEHEPTSEEMQKVESEVNRIIKQDLPITMSYISQEEAKSRFDLNRLPEGTDDTVRVVSIGDYDHCLCIGAHVEHTGEIGEFKLLSQSFSDGILRIRWRVILP